MKTTLVLVLTLCVAFPSSGLADSYLPKIDSGAIDHSLRNRWNEPPRWCGESVIAQLVKLMTNVRRVLITNKKLALLAKAAWTDADESLISDSHSYGFWLLIADHTLAIELFCTAPTVCTMTANLIVRDGASTCLERWSTVAYREIPPTSPKPITQPAQTSSPPKPTGVYSTPHPSTPHP